MAGDVLEVQIEWPDGQRAAYRFVGDRRVSFSLPDGAQISVDVHAADLAQTHSTEVVAGRDVDWGDEPKKKR